MQKRRVTVSMTEEEYLYFKEHAEHAHRPLANLWLHAMHRYCSLNKLPRERK